MAYWYYRYYYLKIGSICDTEGWQKKSWEWQHIRFFNLKIIKEMADLTGFKINKVFGVNDEKLKFQYRLMKYFPNLFASILIIELKKGGLNGR
jgi:hypothetical protein